MIEYRTPVLGDEKAISKCMLAAASLAEMTDGTAKSIEAWYQVCSPAELRERITSGERSLVACLAGEIVGYIAFKRGSHLSLLFVRRDSAGKGIGRQLFERCAAGLTEVTVNSSELAIGFYQKIGFRASGSPRRGDDGVMVLPMVGPKKDP